MKKSKSIQAIVIGTSAGGLDALSTILSGLPSTLAVPILVVIHLPPHKISSIADILNVRCDLNVIEACDKTNIQKGHIYFAPPNYHMMIEKDKTISLSVDEAVNFSRPSIDVLFETAADAYGQNLLGVVLTGANGDGAKGLKKIVDFGGRAIVQNPDDAEMAFMPREALHLCPNAMVMNLLDIHQFFLVL